MKENIIEKLFKTQNKIEKSWNNEIFKSYWITINIYRLFKIIDNWLSEISEIKKISNESWASLTQKIQKLEKLWLIKRKLHKYDKRKWIFEISKNWKEFEEKINKEINEYTNNLFINISEREIEKFSLILDKINKNINL